MVRVARCSPCAGLYCVSYSGPVVPRRPVVAVNREEICPYWGCIGDGQDVGGERRQKPNPQAPKTRRHQNVEKPWRKTAKKASSRSSSSWRYGEPTSTVRHLQRGSMLPTSRWHGCCSLSPPSWRPWWCSPAPTLAVAVRRCSRPVRAHGGNHVGRRCHVHHSARRRGVVGNVGFRAMRRRGAQKVLAGWVILVAGVSSFAMFVILAVGAWVAGSRGPVSVWRAGGRFGRHPCLLVAAGYVLARRSNRVRQLMSSSWNAIARRLPPARALGQPGAAKRSWTSGWSTLGSSAGPRRSAWPWSTGSAIACAC